MPCSLVLASVLKGKYSYHAQMVLVLISISYVLFSIGNLLPLFKSAWPTCWNLMTANSVCNPRWIAAVSYLEVVGIIVGQIVVGVLGDW